MELRLMTPVVGALMLLALAASAQVPAISPAGGVARGKPAVAGPSIPHDPHDLSGVWRWVGRVLTLSPEAPPMTAWGKARYEANQPSYGPRTIPPSLGNDPQGKCDPLGIPRLLFYGAFTTIEFVPVKDRLFQFFEWGHVWRTIWTDGRKLSGDPDQDPRWMGYSVAHPCCSPRFRGVHGHPYEQGFDVRLVPQKLTEHSFGQSLDRQLSSKAGLAQSLPLLPRGARVRG